MRVADDILKTRLEETFEDYSRGQLSRMGWKLGRPEGYLRQARGVLDQLPEGGGTVLDIGTGSGVVPRLMHKLGVRSITVDFPTTGGTAAVVEAREHGVEGHYCHVGQDPLPLPDDSVDCVLLADVIEHLPHSPRAMLADIKRVLKPTGSVVVTTPNATRLTVRLKMLLGHSNWPYVGDYYAEPFHSGHHHEYTCNELQAVFEWAGFTVEALSYYEEHAYSVQVASFSELGSRTRSGRGESRTHPLIRIARPTLIFTTKLLPQLRSEMLLVARKPEPVVQAVSPATA